MKMKIRAVRIILQTHLLLVKFENANIHINNWPLQADAGVNSDFHAVFQ